jgi:hypothetical protein
LAKDDWIQRASVAELYSEIRAMHAQKDKPATQPVQPDTTKAFSSHFGNESNEYGKLGYFNRYDGGDNHWHTAIGAIDSVYEAAVITGVMVVVVGANQNINYD